MLKEWLGIPFRGCGGKLLAPNDTNIVVEVSKSTSNIEQGITNFE